MADFAVFADNHVSATWAFPNNLFVLAKDGEIYKVSFRWSAITDKDFENIALNWFIKLN